MRSANTNTAWRVDQKPSSDKNRPKQTGQGYQVACSENRKFADHNERISNILEGDLLTEIENSLRQQLSTEAFERARHRIPPINVLKRIIKKNFYIIIY